MPPTSSLQRASTMFFLPLIAFLFTPAIFRPIFFQARPLRRSILLTSRPTLGRTTSTIDLEVFLSEIIVHTTRITPLGFKTAAFSPSFCRRAGRFAKIRQNFVGSSFRRPPNFLLGEKVSPCFWESFGIT
jgi:hypothetical protein